MAIQLCPMYRTRTVNPLRGQHGSPDCTKNPLYIIYSECAFSQCSLLSFISIIISLLKSNNNNPFLFCTFLTMSYILYYHLSFYATSQLVLHAASLLLLRNTLCLHLLYEFLYINKTEFLSTTLKLIFFKTISVPRSISRAPVTIPYLAVKVTCF